MTNGPVSPCNIEIVEFNKAMEVLKEAHKHSTNSAGIWKKYRKLEKKKENSNGEFKSNKEFREAIMNWHKDTKPESKAHTSVLMSAFYQ